MGHDEDTSYGVQADFGTSASHFLLLCLPSRCQSYQKWETLLDYYERVIAIVL